jgi:hypothetical protein
LARLNLVPGDDDAVADAPADETEGDDEEGADELDEPSADDDAVLLELPHAASKMRAAPSDAAMGSLSRLRRSRP